MTSPLSNVKVLELAVAIAGPSCAGILADWGASVTKIEPYGDRSRMQYFQCDDGRQRSIEGSRRCQGGLAING